MGRALFSKDFRLISRIDSATDQDISHIDRSTQNPVHFVEVSTPRGIPTHIEIWAEIKTGCGSLVRFPAQTADPQRWRYVFSAVQAGSSANHAEPLEVLAESDRGTATVSIVSLSYSDGWGSQRVVQVMLDVDFEVT